MPTIEVSKKDLIKMIGKKVNLEDDLLYVKGEIDDEKNDLIKIDSKDTNRPDLWSTEGMAREIKSKYKKKFPSYKHSKGKIKVIVDKNVKNIRPYTACAVVRNLKITKNILSQLIQLQEKIAGTFGRNRKEVSIGVYDLKKIKPPIKYCAVEPEKIKFSPLGYRKKMNVEKILKEIQKGKEYGHLLKGFDKYTVFKDSKNEIMSLVPVVNSNDSGNVGLKSKDLFIECSGNEIKFISTALNCLVTALAERGGKIESVNVMYGKKKTVTPHLNPKKFKINRENVNKVSGLNLDGKKIKDLLEKSNYKVLKNGKTIELSYPSYRQDLMHERDVIEDIIIAYGYNNIKPKQIKLITKGKINKTEEISGKIADIMAGLGMQEVMSYTLTNKEILFKKMNIEEKDIAEIENPSSSRWGVFRNWLLPNLISFIAKNKNVEYPQKIFEIGDAIILDEKEDVKSKNLRKLSSIITGTNISYEDISSYLDALFDSMNSSYILKDTKHPCFIDGRCALIFKGNKELGIIGEIHPKILKNFNIEMPVAVFEIKIESFL